MRGRFKRHWSLYHADVAFSRLIGLFVLLRSVYTDPTKEKRKYRRDGVNRSLINAAGIYVMLLMNIEYAWMCRESVACMLYWGADRVHMALEWVEALRRDPFKLSAWFCPTFDYIQTKVIKFRIIGAWFVRPSAGKIRSLICANFTVWQRIWRIMYFIWDNVGFFRVYVANVACPYLANSVRVSHIGLSPNERELIPYILSLKVCSKY